jgi:hypothetical protein
MSTEECTQKNQPAKKSRKGIKLKRHGLSGNPLWNRWRRMIQRCHGTALTIGPCHGKRGIKVCQRWRKSFAAFLEDMGEPPTPKHQIERINNNGHYEPGNCRWATPTEQALNTRQNRIFTINGETKCLAEWMHATTLPRTTVEARLKRGWPIEAALSIGKKIGKPVGHKDGVRHFEIDGVGMGVMGVPTDTHGNVEFGSRQPVEPLVFSVGGVAQLVEQRTFNTEAPEVSDPT